MPTVLVVGPYRFFFVSLDYGEPPHIHVQRDRLVAKFWLEPVQLEKAGGFRPKEISQIARLVEENRSYFLERWHEHFGS